MVLQIVRTKMFALSVKQKELIVTTKKMALKLEKAVRDEMVQALQMQMVPAVTGAVLMQIAQVLVSLIEEEVGIPQGEEDTKTPKK